MSKAIVVIAAVLLLAGCDGGDYESQTCQAAVQGLTDPQREYSQCVQEAWKARFKAAHATAQKYRNMPR